MDKIAAAVAIMAGSIPLLRNCTLNTKIQRSDRTRSLAQIRAEVVWSSIERENNLAKRN